MTIPKILFLMKTKSLLKILPMPKEIREQSPVVLDESSGLQLITRFSGVKDIQTSKISLLHHLRLQR